MAELGTSGGAAATRGLAQRLMDVQGSDGASVFVCIRQWNKTKLEKSCMAVIAYVSHFVFVFVVVNLERGFVFCFREGSSRRTVTRRRLRKRRNHPLWHV